jgi:FMN phosphatase YigB (HAD superfamily)
MDIKYFLFDLDGTLLPMDQDLFVKTYLEKLAKYMSAHGYTPEDLVKAVWYGIKAMNRNDGTVYNEEAFWNTFCQIYGKDARLDEPKFRSFYETEFQKIKAVCGYNKKANELIKFLKENGKTVILATNPVFPKIATESRMRWAGLDVSDFDYYTTYENSKSCKPTLQYYKEILEKFNADAGECLMIGNDVGDDMVVEDLNIHTFLLTDCLINTASADIERYRHGDFDALFRYIKDLM